MLCWIVEDLKVFRLISFCRIIDLKNSLDILEEYRLEYLYVDFYFLCCYTKQNIILYIIPSIFSVTFSITITVTFSFAVTGRLFPKNTVYKYYK